MQLLSAPKIAGLLPARTATASAASDQSAQVAVFTYSHPQFSALSTDKRSDVFAAITHLLDAAAAYVGDQSGGLTLLMAETEFHKAVTGEASQPFSPQNQPSVERMMQKMDADLEKIVDEGRDRLRTRLEEAQRQIIARRAERDRLFGRSSLDSNTH